jgi:hypothetical protein
LPTNVTWAKDKPHLCDINVEHARIGMDRQSIFGTLPSSIKRANARASALTLVALTGNVA